MSLYPKQCGGFLIEEMDGEIILLHPAKNIIVHASQTGALIWQLCDGRRSVDEIIEILGAAYPESKGEISVDVPQIIQTLMSHGVLGSA